MKGFDIRVLAIQHPGLCTSIFLVFWLINILWNWEVLQLRGGILDNALPVYDRFRQMDEVVKAEPDFNAAEIDPLIIFCEEVNRSCFQDIVDTHVELVAAGYDTTSIMDIPDYVDTGEELLAEKYLTEEMARRGVDFEMFGKRILKDNALRGILVGKTLKWFIVGVIPASAEESEIKRSWDMIEIVEGRKIPWWERLTKTDITPKREHVSVVGYSKARWWIDQGLNVDMMRLPFLGVVVSFFILWGLSHSLRQSLIITLASVLSGIWFTRGMIAPIHEFVPEFYEYVYTILAYGNIIVQGISLPLHKMAAYREANGTSKERFLAAREVDSKIGLIARIGIFTFLLGLANFPIWQITVMGIQSIIGILMVYGTAVVFIPAIYRVAERMLGPEDVRGLKPIHLGWYERIVTWLEVRPITAIGCTLSVFGLTAGLFLSGHISARTVPRDYLKETSWWEADKKLRDLGDGNEILYLALSPKEPLRECQTSPRCERPIWHQPEFLKKAWAFQNDFRNGTFEAWQQSKGWNPIKRDTVASVLDKVAEISLESYGSEFVTNAAMSDEIFKFITSSIKPAFRKWSWNRDLFRLSIVETENESDILHELIRRIELYIGTAYPELRVLFFGKSATFPRVDYYIGNGVTGNILTSIAIVFGFYWWWMRKSNGGSDALYTVRPMGIAMVLLIPFLFGAGIMGIIMWFLGVPLSMSTVPIFDLTVNAAADFGVYIAGGYMLGLSRGMMPKQAATYTLLFSGVIVVIDSVLNIIAFLPLTVSAFEPIREIGWMMAGMLSCAMIGAVVFIPAVLPLVTKKLKTKEVCCDKKDSAVVSQLSVGVC